MAEKNHFERLAEIDVSKHIEKKGNLSYLSWPWAVDQLLRADSTANWSYGDKTVFHDGTVMVVCTVTAFGKPMTMHLPVMDYRNKPIANPDAFAVNTAMMRCLVKAIALHGLGLYIYAGEDLPLANVDDGVKGVKHKPADSPVFKPDEEEMTFLLSVVDEMLAQKDNPPEAAEIFYRKHSLDTDEMAWIWNQLGAHSALRREIKKYYATNLKGKL